MSSAPGSKPLHQSNLNPNPQTPNRIHSYFANRRSSDGNFTTPTQIILRIPNPPSPIMEVCHRAGHSQSLLTGSMYINRSMSLVPLEDASNDLCYSQTFQSGSGASTPTSTLSRTSSVDSCSELVAALDAMALDLQQQSEAANREAAMVQATYTVTTDEDAYVSNSNGQFDEISHNDNCIPEEGHDEEKKLTKNLDLAEKEKYLTECKNQIKSLSHSKQLLEKKVDEMQTELDLITPFRTASKQGSAKSWPKLRPIFTDLGSKLTLDDVYVESTEIISAFLESERHYLSALNTLHKHYEMPMKMFSLYKPDIISTQQLNSIFLNCSELVLIHRALYEELSHLPSLPECVQVDKLLEILERTFCSFFHYNSFMDNTRQLTIQKEVRQLSQKQQFVQLLDHCKETCSGVKLAELLQLPAERLTEYSDLLTHFLDPHVRGVPEDGSKRAEALIRFLRNLRYEMLDDKSEWDHTLEKIKLLSKLAPCSPIPLEVFDSDVYLVKQGPLNQVVGNKEVPRLCFLFNKFISIAEATSDAHFKIVEHGMIPLSGAQLHKCVDIEGQAIGTDLQSGLKEDRLAFLLCFHNQESVFFRAAKPNVWKSWTEALEKNIQDCQASQHLPEPEHFSPLLSDVGTKIAAASLEKLFQQLTNPLTFREDFMEVFLMTHRCFTTPKDVLTALLNCIKSPEDNSSDSSSQGSGSAMFPFSMDELTGAIPCASASYSQCATNDYDGSPRSAHSPTHYLQSSQSSATLCNATDLPTTSNDGKSVHMRTSLLSTSDSDTSPHTSAIVVDNPSPGGTHMQNGWLDSAGLKGVQLIHQAQEDESSQVEVGEDNHYTKLLPQAMVRIQCDGSGDESEEDYDGGKTPLQSTLTGSLELGHSYSRSLRQRSLSEVDQKGVDGTLKKVLDRIGHSSKIAQELEDSSKMMEEMIGSLDTAFDFCKGDVAVEDVFHESKDNIELRQKSSSKPEVDRRGVCLSNSEPDLIVNTTEAPSSPLILPHTPIRSKFQDKAFSLSPGRQNHLTESFSFSTRSEPSSPYHQNPRSSNAKYSSKLGKPKAQTMDRIRQPIFSRKKKSESLDRHTGGVNVMSSLNPESIHAIQRQESISEGKSPKRSGKWGGIRKIIGIGKKINRSPSMEADELKGIQDRSIKAQGSFSRKGSLISETLLSISNGANMTDGGVPTMTRQRRSSVSQGNSVALVSKIFAVLECWLGNFFEDFEDDPELKKMLCDFLQTMVHKTGNETYECQFASELLKTIDKSFHDMGISCTNTFPLLLAKTIGVDTAVLMLYDWDHPDKLVSDTIIDLSKIQHKDSQLLKIIAEQITLMEFSVYAAVQRCELMSCNWKKPNKDKLAPNVCRLIRRTNEMTSWVCTEILSRETPSQRATVIENFVRIATYCYKHNDMHCALNITIALGSACIKTLRTTWEEVDKRYRHKFEKLKNWTDYHGRCKKMREKLERITAEYLQKNDELPTVLPYIGAYLDQIYSLEMSSKTYSPDGLVNFAKMTKLASIVDTALQYQKQKFKFQHRVDLMVYVTAAKRLSENDLYELSTMREPPSH